MKYLVLTLFCCSLLAAQAPHGQHISESDQKDGFTIGSGVLNENHRSVPLIALYEGLRFIHKEYQ